MPSDKGTKKAVKQGVNKLEASGVPVTAFITYLVTFVFGMAMVIANLIYSMAMICSFATEHPIISKPLGWFGSTAVYTSTLGLIDIPSDIVEYCNSLAGSSSSSTISSPTLGSGTSGSTAPLVDTTAKKLGYGQPQEYPDIQIDNQTPVVPIDDRYNDSSTCDGLVTFIPPEGTSLKSTVVATVRPDFADLLTRALIAWHKDHPTIPILITELFRTPSAEAQLALKNPRAKGVKFSAHSAAFGFDFSYGAQGLRCTLAPYGSEEYNEDAKKSLAQLPETCKMFIEHMESYGFYWGGKFHDNLHFDQSDPANPPTCAQGAKDRSGINKNCAIDCA